MMDVIAVLLVVVGFAIGWCLRGCHEDEKAAQRIESSCSKRHNRCQSAGDHNSAAGKALPLKWEAPPERAGR
jgi:hypothetical protein